MLARMRTRENRRVARSFQSQDEMIRYANNKNLIIEKVTSHQQ